MSDGFISRWSAAQLRLLRVDPAVASAIVYTARGMSPLDISHAATEHGVRRHRAHAVACTPCLYVLLLVLLIMVIRMTDYRSVPLIAAISAAARALMPLIAARRSAAAR